MRYQLIDRVIDADDTTLTAVKAVTAAEEYLGDHFPGFPVLPGVMMLEALCQAGRALVARLDDTPGATRLAMSQAKNVKYGRMVRPGQTLTVSVTLKAHADGVYDFAGEGAVDGETAVKARFALAPIPQNQPAATAAA
ncbi:MAG: 3-hydroxyacyl-ACP dehydratase FabZ family protein [Planctomycetota bacterium]